MAMVHRRRMFLPDLRLLSVHAVLRPIYVGWMKFAFVLGWINTRLILGLFFYLILTPSE